MSTPIDHVSVALRDATDENYAVVHALLDIADAIRDGNGGTVVEAEISELQVAGPDLTHLGCREVAWEEGFEAGATWHQSGPTGVPNDPPPNPYTALREQPLAYVRSVVDRQFHTDPDDELGDDYIEAILDAHSEWLGGQRGQAEGDIGCAISTADVAIPSASNTRAETLAQARDVLAELSSPTSVQPHTEEIVDVLRDLISQVEAVAR
ncbi:hypothetical protein [Gordonia sp. OPL2]|uniref:hypothetical protein n=1 Tax=Gordonia sp. OPL2 TaxID=2486274 RepID=UPI001655747D|nr:hypothetical protein [Gordonia sp. OPL2]ROZ88973.1 hypothetical protein EEB19_19885 [Gordonia sp. OPL2]